ncbi:MAG TPA: chemotaxis protein CheB [Candidatus Binataceae bacterium]|nr:chemotaxis protein CheB [Candidatus Binataceae bacterium]
MKERLGRHPVHSFYSPPPDLGEFLRQNQHLLIASAIGSGLPDIRRRSAPDRLHSESSSFLELFLASLYSGALAPLTAGARKQVVAGALAGASEREARDVMDIWRRTLEAFLPTGSKTESAIFVNATMDRLSEVIVEQLRRWERRRIDIIVIGASAGGLGVLTDLMPQLDAELPVTLVVVQHLGRTGPSVLPAILARHSGMHIAPGMQGAPLYLGYAYIATPNAHLTVERRRLALSDQPPEHFAKPSIDVLFRSAAQAFGRHLAAIILCGAGQDGADGIRVVHQMGGLTIALSPEGLAYGAMPAAAIATGAVDHVIPELELAPFIRRLALNGRPPVRKLGAAIAR